MKRRVRNKIWVGVSLQSRVSVDWGSRWRSSRWRNRENPRQKARMRRMLRYSHYRCISAAMTSKADMMELLLMMRPLLYPRHHHRRRRREQTMLRLYDYRESKSQHSQSRRPSSRICRQQRATIRQLRRSRWHTTRGHRRRAPKAIRTRCRIGHIALLDMSRRLDRKQTMGWDLL
jgi:hypothetical protein